MSPDVTEDRIREVIATARLRRRRRLAWAIFWTGAALLMLIFIACPDVLDAPVAQRSAGARR